ncbi:MAG: hypothetical protein ACRC8S_03575 [Fimbriiglobus sp.]
MIDTLRPLRPVVEFVHTGKVPPELSLAEADVGKDLLFIVSVKLLRIIRDQEIPYLLDPEFTWCKQLPRILEAYPDLASLIEIKPDLTLDYRNLHPVQKINLVRWLFKIHKPITDVL